MHTDRETRGPVDGPQRTGGLTADEIRKSIGELWKTRKQEVKAVSPFGAWSTGFVDAPPPAFERLIAWLAERELERMEKESQAERLCACPNQPRLMLGDKPISSYCGCCGGMVP